jgi:hypothetical protein
VPAASGPRPADGQHRTTVREIADLGGRVGFVWRGDDGRVECAPGVVARVIAGPFAGHEVVVIELLRNNLVLVLINLLDGATRLELSVLDLDVGSTGPGDAGIREPRRPLQPHGSGAAALPIGPA